MGTVGLAKVLLPSLPGEAGRWGLYFHTLLHSFGMKDGLGLCMMALPIQNVPWEQLFLFNEKRQPVTYWPQAMFYSLYGATGMFSNVVYSPKKCFYLAGTWQHIWMLFKSLSLRWMGSSEWFPVIFFNVWYLLIQTAYMSLSYRASMCLFWLIKFLNSQHSSSPASVTALGRWAVIRTACQISVCDSQTWDPHVEKIPHLHLPRY